MNTVLAFFGRFHPLLVHLPIGFLLLAMILQWLRGKERFVAIVPAIRVAYVLGAVSAVLSCISGWLLAGDGEYDEATLDLHRWMGISVAVVSLAGFYFSGKPGRLWKNIISICLFVLIMMTGHLGGTLTHGEGFLTKGLFGRKKDSTTAARKPIVNVQEAVVYAEIIQPMLTEKCGTCHSAKKQKGGLRLDGKDWILKGGKDGEVYKAGSADASELYKRVILDPLEEKHMPPKGKPQLTEQEVMLLHWWLNSNGGFDKKAKELAQTDKVKAALTTLQSATVSVSKPMIPDEPVDKVSENVVEQLRKAGITVVPVAVNSNYLLANFVSIPELDDKKILLLSQIKKQLVWLKTGYAELSDTSWKTIGQCENLTRLSVEHTNLTDASLVHLKALKKLQYLNLAGTKVSGAGILQLKDLTKLEEIYLGQTAVKKDDIAALQKLLPKTQIDSGNYHVENLATDTQLLKAPPVKK